jgi:hypothetical protein
MVVTKECVKKNHHRLRFVLALPEETSYWREYFTPVTPYNYVQEFGLCSKHNTTKKKKHASLHKILIKKREHTQGHMIPIMGKATQIHMAHLSQRGCTIVFTFTIFNNTLVRNIKHEKIQIKLLKNYTDIV